jgi:VanZ family protein
MKNLLIFLCVLWMGFIFYNSSNIGSISHERSLGIVNFIINERAKVTGNEGASNPKNKQNSIKGLLSKTKNENSLDYIVRKNAHAFEYLVLAVLISALLFAYKLKGKAAVIYILFICLFYAVTDEFHQKFVSLRTSSVTDVLIDFGGSIIGMALFYIIYYTKKVFH